MLRKIIILICGCFFSFGTLAQADLTINPSINLPTDGCYLTTTEDIQAVLVNISGFPYAGTLEMGYSLDWGTAVIETVVIPFMPGSGTFIYTFPVPDDFSSCAAHNLQIWVYDVNDPNNLNDTIVATVISDCDPIPGWVSGADTVCMGINSGEFTLNGSYGNVSSWGASIDGGSTWGWISTPDTFLTYTNISNTTTIKVIVDSPFGLCPPDTTTLYTIYTEALSNAGTLPANFDICDNGNAGFVETFNYVGSVTDWQLSTNAGGGWIPLSTPNDTVFFNNLTDTTWYQVIVQNGSCPADTSAPVILTLIPGTVAGTIAGPTLVCNFANNDELIASPNNGGVIAWWVSSDSGLTWSPLINSDMDTLAFAGIQWSTMFQAEFQVPGCPSEFSLGHYITVKPIGLAVHNDTTINEGDAIPLWATATGATGFLWWPDLSIDDVNGPTPVVDPVADITYFVEVTDFDGCKDTASVNIIVLPDITTVIPPNLFTPNGDSYNDVFEVNNILSFAESELIVFNIYGQQVYNATPYLNDWDGTLGGNGGQKLPDGTYFYVLDLHVPPTDPLYLPPFQGVITIAGND